LTPGNVLQVINDVLDDGVLVTDIGYYRHHANLFAQPSAPERFFTDTGLSSFGSGLPSAAAAQLLNPDKRVVLLCGDGGFHSGSCDLETLVRHELPVVIIVLNNSAYGLISLYQRRGGKCNPAAVRFSRVDFAELAKANGALGAHAATQDALRALVLGHTARKPLLIEVPVDYADATRFQLSF
jgi:N2-(2-carboxyethyl)arginine synthase